MKPLHTERLQLRPMELTDAPALFSFWSDPLVTKHMNISAFTDVEQASEMIALLQRLSEEGAACRWTITLQETSEIIGTCGFNYFDTENARAEIAYDLGSPYWGHGYVTEALQACITYGFKEHHLNRIEAKIEPENERSRRVMSRLHFVEEGLLRQYERSKGRFVDILMYSLLREDWSR